MVAVNNRRGKNYVANGGAGIIVAVVLVAIALLALDALILMVMLSVLAKETALPALSFSASLAAVIALASVGTALQGARLNYKGVS